MALSQKRPVRRAKGQSAAPPDPSQVPSAVAANPRRQVDLPVRGRHRQQQRQTVQDQRLAHVRSDRLRPRQPAARTRRSAITTTASALRTSSRSPCSAGSSASASRATSFGSTLSSAATISPATASTPSASAAARSRSGLLVGMVACQGILQPADDAALSLHVHDAYRAFRRAFPTQSLARPRPRC